MIEGNLIDSTPRGELGYRYTETKINTHYFGTFINGKQFQRTAWSRVECRSKSRKTNCRPTEGAAVQQ